MGLDTFENEQKIDELEQKRGELLEKISKKLGSKTSTKLLDFCTNELNAELLAAKNRNYIDIDFSDILSYDPELATNFLDKPKETIESAEHLIEQYIDKRIGVRIFNLPESEYLPLNDITDQLGVLRKFRGIVTRITEKFTKPYLFRLTCKCGNVMTARNSDIPCSRCGKESKFKIKTIELMPFRRLLIDEEKATDLNRPTIRKEVYLQDDLAKTGTDNLILGSKIEITGYVMNTLVESKNTMYYKTGINALHIRKLDASWKAINLSEEDMNQIERLSQKQNLLADFALSLAPQFHGYEEIRESLILSQVEGKRITDKNKVLLERRTIHILMIGNPSAGKTQLLRRIGNLCPFAPSTSGVGNTGIGLVAAVTQDKLGGWICDSGPVIRADGSCILIDELEKMHKSDLGNLNNVMAEEFAEINKANIHEKFSTRCSIIATANPIYRSFVDEDPIHKQIGLPKDFLDRFDLKWPMRVLDQDKVMGKMLSKHLNEEDVAQDCKAKYSFEEMRKYISSCREILPTVEYNVLNYFKEKWGKFTGKSLTDEAENSKSNRLIENIFRFCYAHCKFYRRAKMNKEDIDYAFDLFKKNFEMLGWIDKTSGLVSYEKVESLPTKEEIKKEMNVKEIIFSLKEQYNNSIPFEVAMLRCKENGIDEAQFEEALEKYKRAGDLFEPRPGKIISVI